MLGHAGIPSIKSERQIFELVFHRASNLSIFDICWKIHTKYSKILLQKLFLLPFPPILSLEFDTFDFLRPPIPENAKKFDFLPFTLIEEIIKVEEE